MEIQLEIGLDSGLELEMKLEIDLEIYLELEMNLEIDLEMHLELEMNLEILMAVVFSGAGWARGFRPGVCFGRGWARVPLVSGGTSRS